MRRGAVEAWLEDQFFHLTYEWDNPRVIPESLYIGIREVRPDEHKPAMAFLIEKATLEELAHE